MKLGLGAGEVNGAVVDTSEMLYNLPVSDLWTRNAYRSAAVQGIVVGGKVTITPRNQWAQMADKVKPEWVLAGLGALVLVLAVRR